MILHSLVMSNVGPFKGEHSLDFRELTSSGLFLISGPTGSGKSTIIDAIVFALYGTPRTEPAVNNRMRSHFAQDSDKSWVELTFETQAGCFLIRRSPAYDKPKRNKSGTTRVQSQVTLTRMQSADSPKGELVSSTKDEVGSEILGIVGLTREQFLQTIVLPQGQFAEFLHANPDSRKETLQRIFGTEVYEEMQNQLKDMKKSSEQSTVELTNALNKNINRFAEAAQMGEERADALLSSYAEIEQTVASISDDLMKQAKDAREELKTVQKAEKSHREAEQKAREQANAAQAWAQATTELAQLSAQSPQHTQDQQRLEVARKAQTIAPIADEYEKAQELFDRANQAVLSCAEEIKSLVDTSIDDPNVLNAIRSTHTQMSKQHAALTHDLQAELSIAGIQKQIAKEQVQEGETQKQIDELQAELKKRPDEKAALVQKRDEANKTARSATALVKEREKTQSILSEAKALQDIEQNEKELNEIFVQQEKDFKKLESQEQRIRSSFIAGSAAHLATALVDDEPCPVCGSLDHPSPAQGSEQSETLAALQKAEKESRDAHNRRSKTQAEIDVLRKQKDKARTKLEGVDLTQVTKLHKELNVKIQKAEQAQETSSQLEKSIESFDAETNTINNALSKVKEELARISTSLKGNRTTLKGLTEQVEKARGDYPSVAERVESIAKDLKSLEGAQRLFEEQAAARATLSDTQNILTQGLKREGFETIEAMRSAALDEESMSKLDQSLKEAARRRTEAEVEIKRVGSIIETDIEQNVDSLVKQYQERAKAAEDTRKLSVEALARAQSLADSLTQSAQHVEELANLVCESRRQVEDAKKASGPVTRLAELANASTTDTDKRIALTTYVLMQRFSDVVAAANMRLSRMSDGRYALQATDEKEQGSSAHKSGLGLIVIDNHTKFPRGPLTLSGGETFYVSLALALGLADVVMGEAGGVSLDTLFIDEGFGSLSNDEESSDSTLNAVMSELLELHRSEGRTVGVISHVAELKSSINDGIDVAITSDMTSTAKIRGA